MISNWLFQWTNWNPQLWREVKSRFKRRNLMILVGVSVLGQLLLLQYFRRQLLAPRGHLNYCKILAGTSTNYACTFVNLTEPVIDWRVWWFDVFHALTWIALLVLLLGGSYLIVKDISREERAGTLALVRLSPQSAHSILLGKVLGVPSLLYFAIALALPLQGWAALQSGLSIITLLGIDTAIGIFCSFAYAFALMYALGWGALAYVGYVFLPNIFILYLPLLVSWLWWGTMHREVIRFSTLVAADEAAKFQFLLVVLLGLVMLGTHSLWQQCLSRFHAPPAVQESRKKR